jgi:signal transduction histidine kinase
VRFAQEFDREITRAFLWLRLDPATVEDRNGESFAPRHDHWLRQAPYPRLVRDVYMLEIVPDGRRRLLRFDPSRKSFEPAVWTPALETLARAVEPDRMRPEEGSVETFLDPVWEDAPALLSLFPRLELPEPRDGIPGTGAPAVTVGVVLLDRKYIQEELIPALARRYLSNGGEPLDYALEIVSRKRPALVVYASGSGRRADTSPSSDTSVALFRISLGDANRDLLVGADFMGAAEMRFRRSGNESYRRVHVMGGARPLRGERAFVVRAPPGGAGGHWQLNLTHRRGSLEQVVAGVRRRNLLVSFGILVVLGLSVTTIVIATRKAQRLTWAQMEFVAGVSHELSTPLAVICTAGENLADGLLGGGNGVRRYGALVRDEGRRLRKMVDQVLEFSAPHGPAARREPVDVPALVDAVLDGYRAELATLSFEVRRSISTELPPVLGDASMLRRAVDNLVRNALKYTGSSRWLEVRIAPAITTGGEQLWLTIQDGGMGIEPAERRRIFEPFYRGREAVARQIHGSGLGLSLVRRIMEQHGGSVTVESEPGRGSAFTLRLPARGNTTGSGGHRTEADEQAHPAG